MPLIALNVTGARDLGISDGIAPRLRPSRKTLVGVGTRESPAPDGRLPSSKLFHTSSKLGKRPGGQEIAK